MAEFLRVMGLAVLQGVTEFLPVSSSGHLVLGGALLGVESPGATLEVLLHTGTLVSILVYYRRRLAELAGGVLRRDGEALRYVAWLALATLPAALCYLLFGKALVATFERVEAVGPALLVTGVLLLLGRLGTARTARVGPASALVVGAAQALALFPGISRSGSTLTASRLRGIEPAAAAEFALLMSVPALGGATLIELLKLEEYNAIAGHNLLLGAVVSGLVGYVSIVALVRMLSRGRLWYFGVYCLVVGLLSTGYYTLGGLF